jgi:hypothetical protein
MRKGKLNKHDRNSLLLLALCDFIEVLMKLKIEYKFIYYVYDYKTFYIFNFMYWNSNIKMVFLYVVCIFNSVSFINFPF